MPIRSTKAKPTRFVILALLIGAFATACGSGSTGTNKPLSTHNGGNGGSPATGEQTGMPAGHGGAPAGGPAGSSTSNTTPPPGGSSGSMAGGPGAPSGSASDGGMHAFLEGGLDAAVAVLPDGAVLDSMLASRPDQGKGDGTDVIMIGDSWMLLGATGISLSLQNSANGGNPAYTNYAVPGTQLLNGQIPSQYTSAKAAKSSIKTVVMTAGGNDVLLTGLSADCAAGGATCQMTLNSIAMSLGQLWNQMGMDGVTDVVHILYSSAAGGGLKDPAANEALIQTYCDAVPQPMHCHLLNTDMLVGSDLMADGIHPSAAACDRVAQAVTDMMQMYGMRR